MSGKVCQLADPVRRRFDVQAAGDLHPALSAVCLPVQKALFDPVLPDHSRGDGYPLTARTVYGKELQRDLHHLSQADLRV